MAPSKNCIGTARHGLLVALGLSTAARVASSIEDQDLDQSSCQGASCDSGLVDGNDSQSMLLLQHVFVMDQAPEKQARGADSAASEKGQLYGSSTCQCIGVNSEGTMKMTVNGTSLEYPRSTGAYCEAWDKQWHPDCQSSSSPSWCRSSWCYVDAASCNLAEADAPEVSLYLQDARFRGLPLYYSYATCSSTDSWTVDHHEEACFNQKLEADCGRLSSRCAWTGSTCAGKELAARILGDSLALSEEFGQESCACIGLSDVSGSTVSAKYGRRDSVAYSADVGSSCQAWDKKANGVVTNSRCSGVVDAWWCSQSWCYVDPCTCTSARNVPRKAQLFPGAATIRGVPLFYSYETCGSMDAYSKTMNKASCPMHTSWNKCGQAEGCYWHSTMGCVSEVFRDYCGVTDQNAGSKTVLAQIYQTARKQSGGSKSSPQVRKSTASKKSSRRGASVAA